MRRAAWAAVVGAAVVSGACHSVGPPPRSGPTSVVFTIEPVDATIRGRVAWRATHTHRGKTARFRIELEPEPRGRELPTFVPCRLAREPVSDASELIAELSRALGGRRPPSAADGVAALDTTAVILGRDLWRGKGKNRFAGSFTSDRKGTWIATKLVLGEGEGEVFLNLDPAGGYGELALKDEDYGRAVVGELSRLLQGEPVGEVAGLAMPAPTPEPRPQATEDPRLAGLVKNASPGMRADQRTRALWALARLQATSALPVFLAGLEDEDPFMRQVSARALARLRADRVVSLAAISPLLSDPDPFVQVAAAEAIGELGEADKAVAQLVDLLNGKAAASAATSLARFGPAARPAVPRLTQMLQESTSVHTIDPVCRALAGIGREASPALPALHAAAASESEHVRKIATYAIRVIEGR